jgi:hypothetical protein
MHFRFLLLNQCFDERSTFQNRLAILFPILLVATGLLVVGCDSGGSNGGGGKSGAVTANVEGGEAAGVISADFSYEKESETCTKLAFDRNFEVPGNKEFDPSVISTFGGCEVESATEWDELEVVFNPDGSADGLTLTLTSGGSEISSTSSTNASGNLSVTVTPEDGS